MSENNILSFEELGDDLCSYCPLHESEKGVHCYGNYPIYCVDSGYCEKAYQNYVDFMEGKIKDIEKEIKHQISERELKISMHEDIQDLQRKKDKKLKNSFAHLEGKIKSLFENSQNTTKEIIRKLKNIIFSHESAKLFNECFGEMAKRDCANISAVTNDILEDNVVEEIQKSITRLENTYKVLEDEKNKYYEENKIKIYKNIDNWYKEEYEKIRRKYDKN